MFIKITGGILAGFLNGLFGSGGGTVIVPFMTELLKIDVKKAHATAILVIFSFTIVSLFFYGMNQSLDFKTGLPVFADGVAGGFFGAKLLKKIPANIIRKIFGLFMIIAAIKMVMQ